MTPELSRKIAAYASREHVSYEAACSEMGRRGASVTNKTGYPSPKIRPPVEPTISQRTTATQPEQHQLGFFFLPRSPYGI